MDKARRDKISNDVFKVGFRQPCLYSEYCAELLDELSAVEQERDLLERALGVYPSTFSADMGKFMKSAFTPTNPTDKPITGNESFRERYLSLKEEGFTQNEAIKIIAFQLLLQEDVR